MNQALESGEVEGACVPLARREERRRRHPCPPEVVSDAVTHCVRTVEQDLDKRALTIYR